MCFVIFCSSKYLQPEALIPFVITAETLMNNTMNSKTQRLINHHKNAQKVLTWFYQLCLHPRIKENISTILENRDNKFKVSKYYDD